ncbi:STAS/SEC14 domain-containing protein [candidate division WOR-3 bacterium]|nr:STAS/SEC14 domain-containing protein [candidate division WOR-3 bacterium]
MARFKINFEETDKVLYVEVLEKITAEDVHAIVAEVTRLLPEGKTSGSYIIGDISAVEGDARGLIDKEARQVFRTYTERLRFIKTAIVGANPVMRMVAKVALAVMGDGTSARFFKTAEDALEWFKET